MEKSVLITLASKLAIITAVIYNIYGVSGKQLQKLNTELTKMFIETCKLFFK